MVCTQKNVQLANLQLKEGYWRVSAASSKVYECSWKGCAGGSISTDGADSLCAEGYEGPECQTCADGYYENSFAGSCSQCDGASVSAALVALVVSLGIICVAVLYCAASQGMKLRVKVGAANNAVGMQSGSDSSCIDMGWWSRFVSGICCPLVSEHVLSHVFASLRTKVKILFVTFQIVSGFEKNVNVEMPSNYLGLLNILSFLNLDIKSVFPIDCWISSKSCAVNYFGEILILTIAPIALSLLLLFFYMAFRVYISFWIPDKVERGTTLNHGYVFCFRVFIAITYIVFPPVSSKLFAVFHYVSTNFII